MMVNLFTEFDPCSKPFSLNWMSLILLIFITPSCFWAFSNRKNSILFLLLKKIYLELTMLKKNLYLLFISLFYTLLIWNLTSLIPYIFCNTSHISITLSMALPLWLSFILFGWINKLTHSLAHLVPQGTPNLLVGFIVLVEMVSILIRPSALAVRLFANMTAGHLLFILLSEMAVSMNSQMISLVVIFIELFLFSLEMAVAMIQAYVFTILLALYAAESLFLVSMISTSNFQLESFLN